ncbi:Protein MICRORCHIDIA 5 [Cardamine amara subsp. amara]|uniref:Protein MICRORCHIDIA 5 n=1 Tax=Cardamine amara subsp. amara TaxID=228776 RepID=A0ABD0ZX22_CARAN
MDSSQFRPKKSLLVIGVMPDRGRTNPNPQSGVSGWSSTLGGHFSKPGFKRSFIKYEDGEASNSLYNKKSRTTTTTSESNSQGGRNIVALEVEPLTIVEAKTTTPKLSRQFWKAGDDDDYVPVPSYCGNDAAVRVHPQFLHANATSHKWALGALAELLDNSLDEVCNGATYVHVDSTTNQKDKKSIMLTVEDNGGGMNPSRFRECLSLGYSRKRHMADKVGQYGNGFKTSTMRLGADAIVFSRTRGINGNNPTQSIGMLSYTFLYETKKCEAIVPTVDFELVNNEWKEIVYNSRNEWFDNLETILEWSPYLSQQDLFDQFESLEEQGTRIVIYNLWEDDEGKLELDFDTDPHDIQLRGVNRDEKNIDMARKYPNSRHFLTYRHSLRSYASILYLRRPKNFRIILRGMDVKHHNLLDDMMMTERKTYTPMSAPDSECSPDHDKFQMLASLELGFVKDAGHHIDIQGFNVYHKNRLIKPFWRVWNAAGSDGRGVIGILEANFIQPAHNKQGFERTAVLAKLENRLVHHQKTYWSKRCQDIGYAPRRKQKSHESSVTEITRPSYQKQDTTRPSFQKQETTRPFNNINLDKVSSSTPAPDRCRQNLESFGRNQNSQVDTRDSGCAKRPEMGIKKENHGPGIRSYNETGSANLAAELRKVKEKAAAKLHKAKLESAAELQKVKEQSVAVLHKVTEEAATKLQKVKLDSAAELWKVKEKSAAELQKLKEESAKVVAESQKLKEESAKVVAESQWQKTLLELQLKGSKAKIQDLENAQKETEELQRQKTLLELQLKKESKAKIQDLENALKEKTLLELQLKEESKSKIKDLENAQKEKEASAKIVAELQRQKTLLVLQLQESQAKIQGLENAQKGVSTIFQEERTRRDVTEDALRTKLQEASQDFDELWKQMETLRRRRMS